MRSRIDAIIASVARGPSITIAGSPGIERSTVNNSTIAPTTVATEASRRRRTNSIIGGPNARRAWRSFRGPSAPRGGADGAVDYSAGWSQKAYCA